MDTVNSTNNRALNPSIAVNMNGSYIICWQDDRLNSVISNNFDIFMQRYNSNGVKIGNNTKVNDDNDTTIIQSQPSVSSDGRGGFAVCWIDGRIFLEDNIFYQLYDSSGSAVGQNKLASSTTTGFTVSYPVCAMRSDRYFFIGWSDGSLGPRKYLGRRFNSNGDPYGNPSGPYQIPVNSFAVEECNDAFILGDRVYATWNDNRQGNFDIFCNVRGFQNPDTTVSINNIHEVIGDFILYPAYPNPFNPTSVIKYDIPKQSIVSLKIYDLLGREVVILVNEFKQPGFYEAVFDGTNYANGVYFYRIEAGSLTGTYVDVKKMVILK